MKNYPYFYFSYEQTPIFTSLYPGVNRRWMGQLFIFTTIGLQMALYAMLAEKFIHSSSFWPFLREKRLEKKEAYDMLMGINADIKPNIIKEFSSF